MSAGAVRRIFLFYSAWGGGQKKAATVAAITVFFCSLMHNKTEGEFLFLRFANLVYKFLAVEVLILFSYRLGLLLIPVGIILLVGGFFIFRGLAALLSIKKGHPGLLSDSAVSKINWTMMRIGECTDLLRLFHRI